MSGANGKSEELEEAVRWLNEHPGEPGSLPGRRFENGESVRNGRDHVTERLEHMDSYESIDDWEAAQLAHHTARIVVQSSKERPMGREYHPLVGQQLTTTVEQLALRAQLSHVETFMRPQDVDLLNRYHVARQTMREIAEEEGININAVNDRLEVATANFLKAYGEHGLDPDIDWKGGL